MTRRKKTDGERIVEKVFSGELLYRYTPNGVIYPTALAAYIDRLLRKRMAEAWEDGWFGSTSGKKLDVNPYRGRRKE